MARYKEAVTEARHLIKRSEADQWRLAELTYQQVKENGVTQQQWARDIGLSQGYVSFLAKVWEQYYQVINRPAFADAIAEAKGMSLDRGERRLREAISNLKKATLEQQTEVFSELIKNPGLRQAIQAVFDPVPTPEFPDGRVRVGDVISEVPTPQERREARERTVSAAFEDSYQALMVLGDRLRRGGIDPVDTATARRYETYREEMQSSLNAWDEAWSLHKLEASL